MVYACPNPDCDSTAAICRRARLGRNGGDEFGCYVCGARFDQPVERETENAGGGAAVGPVTEIGQALMDADPDAIGGEP